MRYYLLAGEGPRLVARDGDGVYDLTAAKPGLDSFRALAGVADIAGEPVDDITARLLDGADAMDPARLDDAVRPLRPDEVWAAGVTYRISEEAREAESGMPDLYLDVYGADRPEIFFKGTAGHAVGPDGAIGIRGDSAWNVPEPELAAVLYRGQVVGYTVGNDVSSREIEGENPLYLPQAKVYDRCCAVGPCVASPATAGDPADRRVEMTIDRDGSTAFEGETSTAEMVRSVGELVSYYTRHNAVPELAVLLTGTSLVPPDEFTLRAGDVVAIEIEGIGRLENPVVEV